jgi:hypothetical protein
VVLPVEVGSTNLVVELPDLGTIHGHLVGFAHSPDVHVAATDDAGFVEFAPERSGDDFTVSEVPSGSWLVWAETDDEMARTKLQVQPGDNEITLRSPGVAHVDGVLSEFWSHAPLPDQPCSWGGASRPVATDAQGRFSLDLPAGEVEVSCAGDRDDETEAFEHLSLAAGATVTLELVSVRLRHPEDRQQSSLQLEAHVVTALAPGGPAAAGGLRVGDHVLSVDGAAVDVLDDHATAALIFDAPPGGATSIIIDRAGSEMTIPVVNQPYRPHDDGIESSP